MGAPIEIEVWQGEISELEVDAIVIPANESLFMTSPIAAAVKRRAGDEVERAAVAQAPIQAGSVVVTAGGRLAAPYVIHAAAVGHDLQPDRERLRSAVLAALGAAEHLGLRRIAVAPLGTERGVFPAQEAAEVILASVDELAARETSALESLVITVSRPDDRAAFQAAVDAASGRASAGAPRRASEG